MSDRLLFVDDDANLLAAFQRNLRRHFTFDLAEGGPQAINLVRTKGPYAVAICDMRMPGMDGIKVLECIRAISPDTVRIMLTGNADQQTAVDAVNRGQIFRFLNKPCPSEVLVPAIEAALKQHQLLRVERELLEGTLMSSVQALADVLALVVPEAHGRGQFLRERVREFAQAAEIGPLWEIEVAALLSPVGFAAVPANVLRKLGGGKPLAPEEAAMVQRVPQVGHDLIAPIPRLEGVARIVLFQHKHFDGGGFPYDPVSGEAIPAGARMLKIMLDRMALEPEGIVSQFAFKTLADRKGVYDPALLAKCFECFPDRLTPVEDGTNPPVAVTIDELATGQIVARNIVTPSGLVLVSAGNALTPMMVDRIRNMADLGEVSEPFLIHAPPPKPAHEPESAAVAAGQSSH